MMPMTVGEKYECLSSNLVLWRLSRSCCIVGESCSRTCWATWKLPSEEVMVTSCWEVREGRVGGASMTDGA